MVSTERIVDYSRLESEAPLEIPDCIDSTWPSKGEIVFEDVSLRYAADTPFVLKDLSFVIASGEKVGIVGRTGAGKSSLLNAIFRLQEPEGLIEIDGVNIFRLGLHDLRKRLSIIPQDPVLFIGSLRKNLDPFDEKSDESLWLALEQVELKAVVIEWPQKLETSLYEGGANLSVGQRQLVCLARALLKASKILVIDEATANVDPNTDALIQRTLRHNFANCTVLTIAHRLHTIIDADRVMVLEEGRMVEFKSPHELLSDVNSVFLRLVNESGESEAQKLKATAAHQSLLTKQKK